MKEKFIIMCGSDNPNTKPTNDRRVFIPVADYEKCRVFRECVWLDGDEKITPKNNTNEDFTIGNVVELKSGGPPMCLEDYNHDTEMYACTWIHDGVSHRDNFYAYCLQKPKSKGGLFGDESETYAEKIEKAAEQIERMKIARYRG